MMICTRCGNELEAEARFCNKCGTPSSPLFGEIIDEDAPTLNLPKPTAPQAIDSRPTQQMPPTQPTSPRLPTSDAYIAPDAFTEPQADYPQPPFLYQQPSGPQPPVDYGQPYQQPGYYQQAPGYLQPTYTNQPPPGFGRISLGDWLSYGWRIYSENWFVMSVATAMTLGIGVGTLGILAGPMIMGLYRMAFKTMKGERPEIADLFNWDGKFLQAFLAFIIYAAIYGSIQGLGGRSGALSTILSFLVGPFLTMLITFTFPMLLERKNDIAAAINDIGKRIFTKDALMWWIVGLVFGLIAWSGLLACGIGILVTLPWIVSASAVAYSNIWGIDDPNRTNA